MDYGALPPEINSARMYAGPGGGPMSLAAAAWDQLAADLHFSALSYQSAITDLTGGAWQGPASASMAAAAAPYATWMVTTAAQCEQVANQARAAVSAYESAFAMTVPPPLIAANRAQLLALVATNFLGQNTPAIMATEAHYGEMWAQDAAAMYGYAASSAAASTLPPFMTPQQNTHQSGLAAQAAAVAQATGSGAASHAQSPALSLSAVPQALQSMASPTSSTPGLSQMAIGTGTSAASSAASAPASALTGLTGASGKGALKGVGSSAQAAAALPAALDGSQLGLILDTIGFGEDGVGLVGADGGGLGVDFAGLGLDFLGADELTEGGGLGPLGSFPLGGGPGVAPFGGLGAGLGGGAGASAGVGQAASLGTLSVPDSWADVAASPVSVANATAVPAGNFGAVPAVSSGGSGMPRVSLPSFGGREADAAVGKLGFRPSFIPNSPMAG